MNRPVVIRGVAGLLACALSAPLLGGCVAASGTGSTGGVALAGHGIPSLSTTAEVNAQAARNCLETLRLHERQERERIEAARRKREAARRARLAAAARRRRLAAAQVAAARLRENRRRRARLLREYRRRIREMIEDHYGMP